MLERDRIPTPMSRARRAPRPLRPSTNYSPTAVVDRIVLDDRARHLFVVRDDLLPGGTKQRACAPFLRDLADRGYSRMYYASPFAGFAQVALAYVASELELDCRLYCSVDPNAKTKAARKHEFTKLAESHGAHVTLVETLSEAERIAYGASRLVEGAYKIPLGFDCLEFREHLENELRLQWKHVLAKSGRAPRQLWVPVGSGTLSSVFKKIIGSETKLRCIDVRVLSREDLRIQSLIHDGSIGFDSTPEKFDELARQPPPIPSNGHYDAKLWQFVSTQALDGDVWWNVAR